ncbi:MAG: hypothetical protein MUD12_05150 [Spirochaetes bacterium]|jgi:hypothetical protein|nr:hypothetical protein [Spirochaetota bacterium]
MKKLILIILILSAVGGIEALASSYSTGGVKSVIQDGSLDVLRNPALISLQKDNNSIGFLAKYIPYYSYSADFRVLPLNNNISMMINSILTGAVKKKSSVNPSLYLSYVRKIGGLTLGIGLNSKSSNSLSMEKTESTYNMFMLDPSSSNLQLSVNKQMTRDKKADLACVISAAFETTEKSHLGLQITTSGAYSNSVMNMKTSEVKYLVPAMILNGNQLSTATTGTISRQYSSELALGYLYADGSNQVGIMIKSGRLFWRDSDTKLSFIRYSNTMTDYIPGFKLNGRRDFSTSYARDISVTAGASSQVLDFLKLVVETELQTSMRFRLKDYIMPLGGDPGNLVKTKTLITSDPVLVLRFGMEFSLSSSFAISAGGMMVNSSIKTGQYSQGKLFQDITKSYNTTYGSMLGFDIFMSESSRLFLGSDIYFTKGKTDRFFSNCDLKENTFNIVPIRVKSTDINLYTYIGMTSSF